jgi:hypothetical protein
MSWKGSLKWDCCKQPIHAVASEASTGGPDKTTAKPHKRECFGCSCYRIPRSGLVQCSIDPKHPVSRLEKCGFAAPGLGSVERSPHGAPLSALGRHPQPGRESQLSRHRHHQLPQNGGKLELAQQMAAHASPRTTSLYDRRGDEISLDEIEKISY